MCAAGMATRAVELERNSSKMRQRNAMLVSHESSVRTAAPVRSLLRSMTTDTRRRSFTPAGSEPLRDGVAGAATKLARTLGAYEYRACSLVERICSVGSLRILGMLPPPVRQLTVGAR
jgi:hypothetical protein